MAHSRVRTRLTRAVSGAALAVLLLLAGVSAAGPAAAAPAAGTGDLSRAPVPATGVVVQHPGNQISIIGDVISLQMTATGGTGSYTWFASGLPTGLTIDSSTGLISGRTQPILGGFTMVTITASGGGVGSVTFRWQVTRDVCPTC